MKNILAALLLTTIIATPAEARRGAVVSGWHQELVFIADSKMPGMALCALVKKRTAFFVPYWTSSEGYALAENQCDTDSFIPLAADQVSEMQISGLIPSDIPAEAAVPFKERFANYGVLGVLAALIGIGIYTKSAGRPAPRQVSGRAVSRKNRSQLLPALIDVMCAMSLVDGDVAQQEIEEIASIYQKMTGRKVSITDIMAQFQKMNGPVNFENMAQAFNQSEREILLEAAMRIATADGRIDEAEYEFMGDMAIAFGLSGDQIRNVLAHMTNTTQTQSKSLRRGPMQPA